MHPAWFQTENLCHAFFALGLNFAWELIYTLSDIFLEAHGPLTGLTLVQVIVNAFWVGLDVLILASYFLYGKKEWPAAIDGKFFIPWSVLGLVCCFALQIVFIAEFGFVKAAQYAAFLQNLLMSVLFLSMFVRRGSMEGQSVLLAAAKWIGTLAPTIVFGVLEYNPIVLVCGIFCTVFDLIYICLLLKYIKKEKVLAA